LIDCQYITTSIPSSDRPQQLRLRAAGPMIRAAKGNE
jgi:hypothetical protein